MGFTVEHDRVRQLHEGVSTRFCEPDNREETLTHTVNVHLSKAQPRWNIQQHVYDVLASASAAE